MNHLADTHAYWISLVSPGDLVIDATCGNGKDAAALALLTENLLVMDIQESALNSTREHLSSFPSVRYQLGCHSTFPQDILPQSVKLIVYNLGYLPGGDKTVTTQVTTTTASIQAALPLLSPGGLLSITCYPGHEMGALEEEALLAFSTSLPSNQWTVTHKKWLNRNKPPSQLFLFKSKIHY